MAELNNTIVKGNLRVTSQAEIQEVIENGTSLANKYLALTGGTINAGGNGTPLIVKGGTSSYREGIRIMPSSNWSDIVLGGNDITENEGTSANSWAILNQNGKFAIAKNGCDYSALKVIYHDQTHNANSWTIKDAESDAPLTIQSGFSATYLRFIDSNSTILGYYGINSSKKPVFYDTTDHQLAYASDYLPLSGGTMTGTVNSQNVVPKSNNVYSLGSSSYYWKDAYINKFYANYSEIGNTLEVIFPIYTDLISAGYLRSDYVSADYPTNDFCAAICRWAINAYPNKGPITLIGVISPNSSGTCILHLYSSSGKDSNNNPMYCSGIYNALGGVINVFGFSNYVWFWDGAAHSSNLNSYLPIAGGTMNGTLESCDIIPTQDNTFDLGDTTYKYNRIYGLYLGSDNMPFYDIYSSSVHTTFVKAPTSSITFYSDYYAVDFGEIQHSSVGEEGGGGQSIDSFTIGTPRSYHYDQGGWTELRMSCHTDGEQDYGFDYMAIRTNGPSAHSVLYLPPLRDGDAETLAITSNIPSVLPAAYVTTPPSSNNYVGIKFVLLNSQTYPESSVTKRNGYIYMWY